jgi:hypothetical protein
VTDETFTRILESLRPLASMPTIFFGGLGEPLFHKQTVNWIAQARAARARAELPGRHWQLRRERLL